VLAPTRLTAPLTSAVVTDIQVRDGMRAGSEAGTNLRIRLVFAGMVCIWLYLGYRGKFYSRGGVTSTGHTGRPFDEAQRATRHRVMFGGAVRAGRTVCLLAACTRIARNRTPHVLFGTYDLLAFRNLNGQLCRRSIDIHFQRCRLDRADERRAFLNVVRSFQHQIPLPEVPDLIQHSEFLYERSIGCIGVLKQWLNRALACAVNGGTALTVRHLERTAMTVPQVSKLLADVMEGEERCRESDGDRELLRARLVLPSRGATGATGGQHPHARTTNKEGHRPGQRSPARDPIGSGRETINAA
jgi:hypothetical protein